MEVFKPPSAFSAQVPNTAVDVPSYLQLHFRKKKIAWNSKTAQYPKQYFDANVLITSKICTHAGQA